MWLLEHSVDVAAFGVGPSKTACTEPTTQNRSSPTTPRLPTCRTAPQVQDLFGECQAGETTLLVDDTGMVVRLLRARSPQPERPLQPAARPAPRAGAAAARAAPRTLRGDAGCGRGAGAAADAARFPRPGAGGGEPDAARGKDQEAQHPAQREDAALGRLAGRRPARGGGGAGLAAAGAAGRRRRPGGAFRPHGALCAQGLPELPRSGAPGHPSHPAPPVSLLHQRGRRSLERRGAPHRAERVPRRSHAGLHTVYCLECCEAEAPPWLPQADAFETTERREEGTLISRWEWRDVAPPPI